MRKRESRRAREAGAILKNQFRSKHAFIINIEHEGSQQCHQSANSASFRRHELHFTFVLVYIQSGPSITCSSVSPLWRFIVSSKGIRKIAGKCGTPPTSAPAIEELP